MIRADLVRQIVSFEPPSYLLDSRLKFLQEKMGYTVIQVIETTTNKVPDYTDQAFLIIYDDNKRVGLDEGVKE